MEYSFHAPAALGLPGLVAEEVRALGATRVRVGPAAVSFRGSLEVGYRACLWSRCASRVLLELARFPAPDAKALYRGAAGVDWLEHMDVSQTFAIRATGTNRQLRHTGFSAQQVKDALVDTFRDRIGSRPSVDVRDPDVQVQLHLHGTWATLSLDLAGAPLHRRGYRVAGAEAPLKENVAAALLLLAGWPEVAGAGGAFVDPMCGGGTLPIEAAWMAGDVAPGLLRERFGLHGWQLHDAPLWERLRQEASARAEVGLASLPPILGFEADRRGVRAALEAVERAGLHGRVHIERRELQHAEPPPRRRRRPEGDWAAESGMESGSLSVGAPGVEQAAEPGSALAVATVARQAAGQAAEPAARASSLPEGLLAVNPPYGQRLGEVAQLRVLYASLGRLAQERFSGYRVAVLTSERDLAACLGLGVAQAAPLRNGSIACTLYRFRGADEVGADADAPGAGGGSASGSRAALAQAKKPGGGDRRDHGSGPKRGIPRASGAESAVDGAFANRLRKRARHLGKWARRQEITCYRIYDADLPEYSVAVDRYEDLVHVHEYAPPDTVDAAAAVERLSEVIAVVPGVLGVAPENVFLKVRKRQRGRSQYRKIGEGGAFREVHEGGHRFLVNLEDYLDAGLFLDHRLVRARLGELARGKRFLNLFCYTGTASVYAARGGATDTTSVDRSGTYLGWARRNLALNGLSERRNALVRADSRRFLAETRETWDLIFVDPPTFSNTKSGDPPFEVQRDHPALLAAVARRLSPGGLILFSTNRRRFRLEADALPRLEVKDVSAALLPEDFRRTPRIHQVFELRAH